MKQETRIEIAKEAAEQPALVNRTALRSGKFKIIRDADGLLQIVGDKPPRAKDALVISEKEALEMADIMRLLYAKSHYADRRPVKTAESGMNVLEQINSLVKQAQVGTPAMRLGATAATVGEAVGGKRSYRLSRK